MYNTSATLSQFAKTCSDRAERLAFLQMRNLLMIAERNNWPHSMALRIFSSNR
jgi:hypothetical protein